MKYFYRDDAVLIAAIVAIIVVLILIGMFSVAQTYDYKVSWLANTETDMWRYRVYLWEGKDTTQSPFVEGTAAEGYADYFYKFVNHENVDTIKTTVSSPMNGNYLQVAVAAEDSSSNLSVIAVSNFLKKDDKQAPAQPKKVEVDY